MTELEREKGNSCGKGEGNEMEVRRWWRKRRRKGDGEDGVRGERGAGNGREGGGGPRRCLLNY